MKKVGKIVSPQDQPVSILKENTNSDFASQDKDLTGEDRKPGKMKEKFHNRAVIMAVEENNETQQNNYTEILEFQLGSETYAFESKFVREVCILSDFTKLPGLPEFVLGITNVRGQIISIIDLKKLVHIPSAGLGELNKVIIIQNNKMELGILIDGLIGTNAIYLPEDSNKLLSDFEGGAHKYMKALTSDHLIVLDAAKILDDKSIIVYQEEE